jgi:membrane protein
MDKKRIVSTGTDFMTQMSRQNIAAYAASAAFFIFMALIPLLMLTCSVLRYTSLTEHTLVLFIESFIPPGNTDSVERLIREVYRSSSGIMAVSLIMMLWSASAAILAIIRGLNSIYGLEDRRNYFTVRGVACVHTVFFLGAVVILMFMLMYGKTIALAVMNRYPDTAGLFGSFLLHARYFVAAGILTVLFNIFYAVLPAQKQNYRAQMPGAIFSSAVWSVSSWVFSFCVTDFGTYSMYGSLAAIVISMFYMYMMMYIIFVGAHINYYLAANVKHRT